MRVYIISEICGQWGGEMKRAEQMILQCKMGGADAVKVQLWDTYKLPGENREKWEYLQMSYSQYVKLKSYAESLGLDFFASVFDEERFDWLIKSNTRINKISSFTVAKQEDLMNKNLSQEAKKHFHTTYASLGMVDYKEGFPYADPSVKWLHCVSKYPHEDSEAIEEMPSKYDDRLVGYSCHAKTIEPCIEAVRRGATIIEKHFTTDKMLQCSTESAHSCSMVYDDLVALRNACDLATKFHMKNGRGLK